MMNQISVVIIAQNEAARIARAVQSVHAIADEVLVVDGGSGDATAEIARAAGARVILNPWPGFAEQRNFGAAAAKNDWIFMLDADEVPDAELTGFLASFGAQPVTESTVYAFRRMGDFLGKFLPGQDRHNHIRLYNRHQHQFRLTTVHEVIVAPPEAVRVAPGLLLHYGFRSIADHVDRFNRYTDLEAAQRFADGQRFRLLTLITRPPARFVYQLVRRGLWRQGIAGVFVSLLWVYYDLMLQMKLYERELASIPPARPMRHQPPR